MADTAHNYGDKNRNMIVAFNDFNHITEKNLKEDIDTSFTLFTFSHTLKSSC